MLNGWGGESLQWEMTVGGKKRKEEKFAVN